MVLMQTKQRIQKIDTGLNSGGLVRRVEGGLRKVPKGRAIILRALKVYFRAIPFHVRGLT